MARADAIDEIAAKLESLENAVDAAGTDDALREAELRLGRRIDVTGEAIRTRIDDQRVLADSLAANVSQLNAALTKASEEPQQLRRDLDRILEQLAERMGAAMRDLRSSSRASTRSHSPCGARSRPDSTASRAASSPTPAGSSPRSTSAQEDADSRLRRIDTQVTELRRAVELVRRSDRGERGRSRPTSADGSLRRRSDDQGDPVVGLHRGDADVAGAGRRRRTRPGDTSAPPSLGQPLGEGPGVAVGRGHPQVERPAGHRRVDAEASASAARMQRRGASR